MTSPLDVASLEVGQELPVFVRTVGFHNFNRYAAVNDEFVPIHMDDEAGRAAGFPRAFGMGNLQFAYLHLLLHQWMGVETGRIVSVDVQFRTPTPVGTTCTAKGVITGVRPEGDEVFVDLEVWTENDEGAKLAPATAVVALPA